MVAKSSKKVAINYSCDFCDYNTCKKSSYDKHLLTSKHINIVEYNNYTAESCYEKIKQKYICDKCDYKSYKKGNYAKHLTTSKHLNATSSKKVAKKVAPKIVDNKIYSCECGNKYNYRGSLYNHKKKCNNKMKESSGEELQTLSSLVVEMVKSNNDLQKQVLDVCKNIQPNISNSNNNSNNKTFNLQFFLNEQCKDAMNITDFINSVTLSLTDLENMGSSGYVNGISSIIIKELRGLDITKRPVHCSDAKRETLYIKDEDKWEKECPENTKMKTAIRTVEKKNIKLISEWTDKHPKFTNSTTKENDEYLQILIETMGGKGDYEKNKNKIIKNIAKEVVIDK